MALLLSILAAASTVLFLALENNRLAERARQERFMRNAAFSVVDDLGSELFTMYTAFSFDLYSLRESGLPVDRQALSLAVQRYRAQARFPLLLRDISCLVPTVDGRNFEYYTWNDQGWLQGPRPSWAVDLHPPTVTEGDGPLPRRAEAAFSLERPVLTVRLRNRPQSKDVVAVALRFDTQVILQEIVPSLVRQRFSESEDALPYTASVRNLTFVGVNARPPADWMVPLLPWTPFDNWFDYYLNRLKTMDHSRSAFENVAGRGGAATGTGWALAVRRLPAGLEAEMTTLFWMDVALSSGFFLVLALGFVGLYGMVIQSRNRARMERTFLALVSHELKTPLAVVRSLADNLARGIGTDEARARQYGEILKEESDRLSQMVGNVLGLTAARGGLSPQDRSPVDLGEVVRDRVDRQEPAPEGTEVEVKIHPGLPLVLAHAAALTAAVDNLVGNAYRHGAQGPGTHHLKFLVEPRRRWGIHGVELIVSDDGPGFSMSEGLNFRKPFRRGDRAKSAQTPGGGVGLSLVRTTALALGGRLTWQSSPGRGAEFRLWLRAVSS